MCLKTVKTDKNMQENFSYTDGEMAIVRRKNDLDEYMQGEINCHWHREFQFGLVLKGELDYSLFQTPILPVCRRLRTGDGYFVNSKALHSYRQTMVGTEIFTFGVSPSFAAAPAFGNMYRKMILPVMHSQTPGFFLSAENPEDAAVLKLFRQLRELRSESVEYELDSMELLCKVWRKVYQRISRQETFPSGRRIDASYTGRIREMLEFIHQHFHEPLNVDQIARAGGVSRRECYRRFREIIHLTPGQYLNFYRLSVAAYLLTNTEYPIFRIGESCGFENMSYFIKLFKNRYGMTPRQFRA